MTNDAPAQASVEAVARIIDPKSWEAYDHAYSMQIGEFRRFADRVVKPSLATASEVLAALSPPPTVGAEDEPVVESAAIRIIRNRAADGPSADRAVAHARQFDTCVWRDAKRDARAALAGATRPAPAADGQRVKALEWNRVTYGWLAFEEWYRIEDNGPNWQTERYWLYERGERMGKFDTLEGAQSFIQARHDARIRACLATDKEGA